MDGLWNMEPGTRWNADGRSPPLHGLRLAHHPAKRRCVLLTGTVQTGCSVVSTVEGEPLVCCTQELRTGEGGIGD